MFVQINNKSTQSISSALWDICQQPIDANTRRRAVLHWIDWLGCVAAGANSPSARALRNLSPISGNPQAPQSLLGDARDDWHATLLDAGPANAEEMDDMHREAILHPAPVIMAALAGLARSGLPAKHILDAVVRGYEVMIRIGRALGPHHYFHWHNTATAGTFGAAAACADAWGLSREQAVWALGNAGTQAAGLWQVRLEPVMSKQLHCGHAAWAGRSAALLASHGFSGPTRILEGERGFFAAMCPDSQPEAVLRPDSGWLIHSTSFKPWPSCRHTHATIDSTLALRSSNNDTLVYDECIVETFNDALSICNNPAPATRTEAKFSLQYCVAAAAHFGPLRPEHFDEEWITHPLLREAASRVKLQPAADVNEQYPAHYGARVTMVHEGRVLTHAFTDSLGDPERPMDEAAILDKASSLMEYGKVAHPRQKAALQAVVQWLDPSPTMLEQPLPPALLESLF